MKKHKTTGRTKHELIFAAIYFTAIFLLYILSIFIIKDYLRFLFLIPLGVVFYFLRLIILLPLSKKKRSIKNKAIRFCICTTACTAITVLSFMLRDMYMYRLPLYPYTISYAFADNKSDNTPSIVHDEDGRFIITMNKDEFKILQLTDLHIGGTLSTYKQDFQAFASMYRAIKAADPDLIIITGDLVYPIPLWSLTLDNRTPLIAICDFMSLINIPWAFVYGNHETEQFAACSANELNESLTAYTFDRGGKLLFSQIQPDIDGRYNNLIEIRNSDGTLNQALFLLDSNDYFPQTQGSYDCIHSNQIEWYRQTVLELNKRENKIVSSMLFFHIPIPEYEMAFTAMDEEADNAEYLFGMLRESCSCPDTNSGLFDMALELKSTKAMFCGHDHRNDIGIRYCGIDLVYGKSIDYLAYPGIDKMCVQRGGTIITLLPDSEYRYSLYTDFDESVDICIVD